MYAYMIFMRDTWIMTKWHIEQRGQIKVYIWSIFLIKILVVAQRIAFFIMTSEVWSWKVKKTKTQRYQSFQSKKWTIWLNSRFRFLAVKQWLCYYQYIVPKFYATENEKAKGMVRNDCGIISWRQSSPKFCNKHHGQSHT